jgi:hypothetical protein
MGLFVLFVVPDALAAYPGFHTPRRTVYCRYAQAPPLGLTCWRPRDGYTMSMHVTGRVVRGYVFANRKAYEDFAPTLRYGKTWGGTEKIFCRSLQTGLTCKNKAGHGWVLGKVSYKVF